MAPSWDLGSLIVAIVAVLVALFALNALTIYQYFIDRKKAKRRCPKITWDAVSDFTDPKSLHPCSGIHGAAGYHKPNHVARTSCWESDSSMAGVFPRGWDPHCKVRQITIPVPQCFPKDAACIATDVRTLLAFVILTAPNMVGSRRVQGAWNPDSGNYGTTSLEVSTSNDTKIVHVRGSFVPSRQTLIKDEVSRMIEGFPPWYRESVKNKHGVSFPFPIKDLRDLPRAGWVLAVGFTDTMDDAYRPVPVYRLPSGETSISGYRQHGAVYRHAIERCRDHLKRHVATRFTNSNTMRRSIESLNYLIEHKTNSDMPHREMFELVPMDRIAGSEILFSTMLFNKFKEIKDEDAIRLEPIIEQVLAACVLGAEEIVRYLKDDGMELKIPHRLTWLDDVVYLRDCSET